MTTPDLSPEAVEAERDKAVLRGREAHVDCVLRALAILRETCPDLARACTQGGCVQFGLAMQALLPGARILYDGNHALVEHGGVVFDIRGPQTPTEHHIPAGPEHDALHWKRLAQLRPQPAPDADLAQMEAHDAR